jgi:DNA ligase-1
LDFAELARIFEELETTSKRLQLAEDIAQLFSEADSDSAKILAYLCQGVLVPEFTGINLGIGDKLAQQAVALVTGRTVKEIEASYRKTGDLGTTTLELVGKSRQQFLGHSELSVQKVYDNFYKIATASGGGSQEQKIKLIAELLSNSDPVQAKVIVRFVIGNLRLGVGESTILDGLARLHAQRLLSCGDSLSTGETQAKIAGGFKPAKSADAVAAGVKDSDAYSLVWVQASSEGLGELVSKIGRKGVKARILKGNSDALGFDSTVKVAVESEGIVTLGVECLEAKRAFREELERAFNLRSDLGLVAQMFVKNGMQEIKTVGPQAFSPIRPALAERLEGAKAIMDKLGTCVVQAKYDGLRLQVHCKNGQVRLYSRRQEPVTQMFPDIVEAAKTQLECKEIIIEGEAIAVSEETGEFMPFQATIQRKRKHGIAEKAQQFPLKLFAFELLYLDGKDYTNEPYSKRAKKLEQTVAAGPVIQIASSINAKTPQDLQRFFDESVTAGLEGIIAKDLNAPYTAGARKFAWIKLKRSYQGKLSDTIDAVVIGYYLGKGKRTQFGLGGLLAAVYSPGQGEFKSIAKIGTGFTEAELAEFRSSLDKIKVKAKPANVKSMLEPDAWVKPR